MLRNFGKRCASRSPHALLSPSGLSRANTPPLPPPSFFEGAALGFGQAGRVGAPHPLSCGRLEGLRK